MAKEYDAHLFICTNRKGPSPDGKPRASCALRDSEKLRDSVKTAAARRLQGQNVRVNASGCLGACEEGIAAVCYSRSGGHWQVQLTNSPESEEILLRTMEEALES
jgi:predicted metal-binding protein